MVWYGSVDAEIFLVSKKKPASPGKLIYIYIYNRANRILPESRPNHRKRSCNCNTTRSKNKNIYRIIIDPITIIMCFPYPALRNTWQLNSL